MTARDELALRFHVKRRLKEPRAGNELESKGTKERMEYTA